MNSSMTRSKQTRYGYVYHFIFTRPTDGREFHYVGQHVGDTVDKRYFGSGRRLVQFYNKYGIKNNLVRTGLMWCYSKHELDFAEIVFIAEARILYGRDCINLNYGGDGGRKSRIAVDKQRKSLKEFYETPEGSRLRKKLSDLQSQRTVSEETRAKLSIAGKGKKRSPETCAKIGAVHKGRKRSDESRARMVESWSKRATVTCPHCSKTGSLNLMNRWHFDNCKVLLGTVPVKEPRTPKVCPHCGVFGFNNITRYHFDNCKSPWLV